MNIITIDVPIFEQEIWRIIPDFPAYRVSNLGNIQSRFGVERNSKGWITKWILTEDNWKNLKLTIHSNGYIYIRLQNYAEHKSKIVKITRLVADLFLPKPENYKNMCVRHLDGNRTNNKASNLAWGTFQENSDDIIIHRGKQGLAKFNESDIKKIRSLKKQNPSLTTIELSKQFNTDPSGISKILRYKTWKWVK